MFISKDVRFIEKVYCDESTTSFDIGSASNVDAPNCNDVLNETSINSNVGVNSSEEYVHDEDNKSDNSNENYQDASKFENKDEGRKLMPW